MVLFGIQMFCNAANAVLSADTAKYWAEAKGQQILSILAGEDTSEKHKALDIILSQDIDLDYAARFVVGKYWKTMTPEQQQKYVPLFRRYVTALYKNYPLDIPQGAVTFKIDKTIAAKDTVNVYGTIFINTTDKNLSNAQGFKVVFTLIEKDNHPKVRDLKIEESSLLLSFRDRFYQILHQDDGEIEWFLEDFEALVYDAENKHIQ